MLAIDGCFGGASYEGMSRAFVFLLLLAACGAKTELETPEFLVVLDGSTPACFRDQDCTDGVSCTNDTCVNNACTFTADDRNCDEGLACSAPLCDPTLGCMQSPIVCDDGIDCTVDSCAEPMGCQAEPDDLRCPVSFRCEPDRGCVAQALVHDDRTLYQVDLPSGESEPILAIDAFTDIALAPDRTLFACSRTVVAEIDRDTGRSALLMEAPSELVALEVGPDGALYAAALDDFVQRIDVDNGTSEVYGRLPRGWAASGDIAFIGERMLITVTDEPASRFGENQLAEVLPDGSSRLVGPSRFPVSGACRRSARISMSSHARETCFS